MFWKSPKSHLPSPLLTEFRMKRKTESPVVSAATKKVRTLDTELLSSDQLVSFLLPELLSDLTTRLGETVPGIIWGAAR